VTTCGLVHGAFHGGWCWDALRKELEARGHRTVAMDLPYADLGAGAMRSADAVAGAVAGVDDDLVLVGHSLAGLVIPLVASTRPVRRLVYLCALLPTPGRSFDDASAGTAVFDHYRASNASVSNPDGSTSCPPARALELFYHDCPPALARWAAARLRPQRWLVLQEATPLDRWPQVPQSYVVCEGDRAVNPAWSREAAGRLLRTEAIELPGGHSPFLSRPAELADLLAALSEGG
jgi:pimeloyl-ACP methyl ester carboxylesterase